MSARRYEGRRFIEAAVLAPHGDDDLKRETWRHVR